MSGGVSLQGEVPVYSFLWGKECNPMMRQEARSISIGSSSGQIHLNVEPVIFRLQPQMTAALALLRKAAPLLFTRWGCLAQCS